MRAFRGLRVDPDPTYDAVVIGAGVGGLVCANLLARQGLRVLLVEQHYMVGGYCSTFRRGAYTFDAATHFYPLLGNPRTLTGAVVASLDVPTRWVRMDPVDLFHLPDGTTFTVPADLGVYLARLHDAFPTEREGIDRFVALVREAYLYGLLYYFRGRRHERLEALEPLTLREVIDAHVRDPRLRLILAADCGHWGSPPSRTSFVFDAMLRLSYFLGNYYPVGGSQAFADDLAATLERHGGHVLLRSEVRRILVEHGRAAGIEMATGLGARRRTVVVRAPHVISNADLRMTVELLLDGAPIDASLRDAVRTLRPTYACFLTHLALRGQPSDALHRAAGYHWRSWDTERVAGDVFKVFVPTMYEPDMAPEGGQIAILQRLVEEPYDTIRDWAAHKRAIEHDLLARFEAVLPGVTGRIAVGSSASALTSSRFTFNAEGAMLGWEMSPWQLGERRPAIDAALPGVYLVGHWTRPGGGITPVIVSAMEAARMITGTAAPGMPLDVPGAASTPAWRSDP